MRILNSTIADLDVIFDLFDNAIAYQQKNGYELWPLFSRPMIETEINEKRHWKIVDNNTITCVFSVMYNDPLIWGEERDKEPAVYLHRIAVNPLFKGRGMMNQVKNWAMAHARQNGKKYVRMDTWGHNENIRQYYISCGFQYLGQQYLREPEAHYGGSVLSLFQIEV